MKAEKARAIADKVVLDFKTGMSAKAISKKYKMHERHVAMLLCESGINPKEEYKKRLSDGTYKEAFSHHYEHGDSWYIARYGKPKEYYENQREIKQQEREIKERKKRIKKLICLISKHAAQRAKEEQRQEREMAEAEQYVPMTTICKHCNKEFVFYPSRERYGRRKPPLYCSKRCKNARNRKGRNAIQRLKAYGREDEYRDTIHLKDLVIRDQGKCYICSKEIDWNDYRVDQEGNFISGANYPTIEHVKPLVKGGTHTWENVKLAHHLCNAKKGVG